MLFLFSVISVLDSDVLKHDKYEIRHHLYTRAVNASGRISRSGRTRAAIQHSKLAGKLPVDKNKPPYNEGWNPRVYVAFHPDRLCRFRIFLCCFEELGNGSQILSRAVGVRRGSCCQCCYISARTCFESAEEKKEIPGIADSK